MGKASEYLSTATRVVRAIVTHNELTWPASASADEGGANHAQCGGTTRGEKNARCHYDTDLAGLGEGGDQGGGGCGGWRSALGQHAPVHGRRRTRLPRPRACPNDRVVGPHLWGCALLQADSPLERRRPGTSRRGTRFLPGCQKVYCCSARRNVHTSTNCLGRTAKHGPQLGFSRL